MQPQPEVWARSVRMTRMTRTYARMTRMTRMCVRMARMTRTYVKPGGLGAERAAARGYIIPDGTDGAAGGGFMNRLRCGGRISDSDHDSGSLRTRVAGPGRPVWQPQPGSVTVARLGPRVAQPSCLALASDWASLG